jgi:hypothetical protein
MFSLLFIIFCDQLHYLIQFIETSPELGSHYNEVISCQDVAMYGGLCALATFDRAELKACTQILILLVNGNCETLIMLLFWFHFLLFAEQSYRQYCLQEFLGVSAWSKGTYKWFLLKASCCTFFFLFGVISTHHTLFSCLNELKIDLSRFKTLHLVELDCLGYVVCDNIYDA